MSKFIEKWVPILDEHTLTDDDGNPVVELNARRLKEIARRNNLRVAKTGDASPIVIGHTEDDAPETDQPSIVGWMTRYKVAPWKMGKKAIYALCKFYKHLRPQINKYPRRSVELWLSDWKIDPLSLLGATTPERDLGLLQLSRDGRRRYKRTLPKMDQTKEIVHAVLAALKESDVWKWCESKMKEEEGAGDDQDNLGLDDDLDADLGDDLGGENDLNAEGLGDDQDATDAAADDLQDDEGEQPVKLGAGYPSGSNVSLPGDRRRMAKDAARVRLSRQERMLHEALKSVNDMKVKYQRAVRERDLVQLEAEGYDFDRVEELDAVAGLSEPAYQKHLARVRKRYRKAPVGRYRDDFAGHERSAVVSTGRTRERAREVADYASRKGVSYETALQELGETE